MNISINRASNGYTIDIFKNVNHPVDFQKETILFHTSKEVLEYLTNILVDVPEAE